MEITYADLERWDACERDTRYTLDACLVLTGGRKAIAPEDVFGLDIPPEDKLWLLLRPECIPEPALHLLACDFAEHMLLADCDPRSRAVLEVKRRWLNGQAIAAELDAARDAAWAADYAARAARDAYWGADSAARAAWVDAVAAHRAPTTVDTAGYAAWAAGCAAWVADYDGHTAFGALGALTACYANRGKILQWQLERVREVLK